MKKTHNISKKTMYLNVILTILVLVLITICTLTVLWWKKYGKELFSLIINMKNMKENVSSSNTMLPDLNSLLSDFESISKNFGKFGNNKNL